MSTVCIILNNQLSLELPVLKQCNKRTDAVLLIESQDFYNKVKHHKKKLVFFMAAQRSFADTLRKKDYNVFYSKLDSPDNTQTITGEIKRFYQKLKPNSLEITWPADYWLYESIQRLQKKGLPINLHEDTNFLISRESFADWAKGKKTLRMEFFYRLMRKNHEVLMENNKPVGGKWNFDHENRKFHEKKDTMYVPSPKKKDKHTKEAMVLVQEFFGDHFGNIEPFYLETTRQGALNILKDFVKNRLAYFGQYQDVMLSNEPFLFHSALSFYLNIGLLHPLECIRSAEQAYYADNNIPLNAVEGFIRQILGWREYVRGLYWYHMPKYKTLNFLEAKRKLPSFYWDGETKLNCLKQCVKNTQENAYAHHIQRLMVLGNFALLAGIDPTDVNEWYWIVYADAFEWVELPNVSGMTLFADGGILGSKPYAASGAYINRMSDYCKTCTYSVKEKTGDNACPFNYLYWAFLIQHEKVLKSNPRMSMPYMTLRKMKPPQKKAIQHSANKFLDRL